MTMKVLVFCALFCALFGALFGALFQAHAQTDPTPVTFENANPDMRLVELYTSQGCSSCPVAERWLNKFEDSPKLWKSVVPVAFHVDYWDQLGWPDPYASPLFSKRQRNYKRNGNIEAVYTPGFVHNGKEWQGFYYKKSFPTTELEGKLSGELINNTLNVAYTNHNQKNVEVNVAILGVGIETHVERGENSDLKLKQSFVVLRHQQKKNQTDWVFEIDTENVRPAPRYALAIWVSDVTSKRVLQAAGGWL